MAIDVKKLASDKLTFESYLQEPNLDHAWHTIDLICFVPDTHGEIVRAKSSWLCVQHNLFRMAAKLINRAHQELEDRVKLQLKRECGPPDAVYYDVDRREDRKGWEINCHVRVPNSATAQRAIFLEAYILPDQSRPHQVTQYAEYRHQNIVMVDEASRMPEGAWKEWQQRVNKACSMETAFNTLNEIRDELARLQPEPKIPDSQARMMSAPEEWTLSKNYGKCEQLACVGCLHALCQELMSVEAPLLSDVFGPDLIFRAINWPLSGHVELCLFEPPYIKDCLSLQMMISAGMVETWPDQFRNLLWPRLLVDMEKRGGPVLAVEWMNLLDCDWCNNSREGQRWNETTRMFEPLPFGCTHCCPSE